MPSNHLILCRPLLLLPSIFPSIRVFSNKSALCIRWPKYWSFSFSISPSNEHPGLISFRMDWLDLLAAQGTLKSLLQHHSSKASILWCSAFFIVQLSHPYVTTGKTIALTRRTLVDKVAVWAFSSCGAQTCHCSGFSCCAAQAPGCTGFSSCGSQTREHRSIVVAHRLSCSVSCQIFLYQGLNPCLLHWQANSLPLSHQRSPRISVLISFLIQ